MSHIATIVTQIIVKEYLLAAIKACGFNMQENGHILNEYKNEPVSVNVAVSIGNARGHKNLGEFGYTHDGERYNVAYYTGHNDNNILGKAHKIAAAYAEELVRAQMSKNKFLCKGSRVEAGKKIITFGKDISSVIISISNDGKVEVETKGYKGKTCVDATQQLEIAIGKVTSNKKTPESYEPPPPARYYPSIKIDSNKLCG
ncbi:MAG: DUF2997 domain-containing protein [Clostridia bacterium]|nr:DUF2997 domain-containing protein [Clostridia bacterium]